MCNKKPIKKYGIKSILFIIKKFQKLKKKITSQPTKMEITIKSVMFKEVFNFSKKKSLLNL